MVISEATNYVTGGVYREIVSDEKLVFTWGAVGRLAGARRGLRLEDSPLVTVTLTPIGESTEIRVRVELPAGLSEEGVREWWRWGSATAGARRSTGSLRRSEARRHPSDRDAAACPGAPAILLR